MGITFLSVSLNVVNITCLTAFSRLCSVKEEGRSYCVVFQSSVEDCGKALPHIQKRTVQERKEVCGGISFGKTCLAHTELCP